MIRKKAEDRITKSERIYTILLGILGIMFYGFFAFYDGYFICVDSPTYISMDLSREPGYPILLALFRRIFIEEYLYLQAIVIFQSMLAALSTWMMTIYLKRKFNLNKAICLIIFLIPIMVSLLNRFAAGRASMYSNSIMTEGVTLSLFLIFFRYLLELYIENTRKSFLISIVLSVLLVLTRKQMLVSLILLVLTVILKDLKNKKRYKALIQVFFTIAIVISITKLIDNTYNYVLRGEFTSHASDDRFLLTMLFYTAEAEDGMYIQESSIRNLYDEIYNECQVNGYLKSNSQNGWYHEVSHFGDNYDHVQIDVMWPAIREFAIEEVQGTQVVQEQEADRIMQVMISSLLPHKLPAVFGLLVNNFLSGLITTIAQRNLILILYSMVMYILFIILLIKNMLTEKFSYVTKMGVLTLLAIFVNVSVVSAVIFAQARYTIYNMPLFYITMIIMFTNLIKNKKID